MHGKPKASSEAPESTFISPSDAPELASSREQFAVRFRLSARGDDGETIVASRQLELVNERVMGKICWPAAEALAARLLAARDELARRDLPSAEPRVFVELGAGCALPSLAAAASTTFCRVVATDMTAERVAIAARNAKLNRLDQIVAAQLDFDEWRKLDDLVGPAEGGCVVGAAEVHYNPEALEQLITSVGLLLRARAERAEQHARARPDDELLLARSCVFAHNDELMHSLACTAGLAPRGEPTHARTGGLLHAASPTLFDPNPNDAVDIFQFMLSNDKRVLHSPE
jgi:predicted nicotinamide N-methyase